MAAPSELDKLAAQAATLETPADDDSAGGASGPVAVPETQLQRNTRAVCALLALLRETTASSIIFDPPLQTLARRLTDDKLPHLVEPWAAVLEHYGFDMLAGFDHPLAVALLTTGPALASIAQELAAELRARRARPVATADAAPTERTPPAM